MSEIMNTRSRGTKVRSDLLATVSSVALLGYVCATGEAIAASRDEDRPIVWIELGGQAERISGAPEIFSPPFFSEATPADLAVLTGIQRPPLYSTGLDGKISFQPENSDWVLSAAIRYGRSNTRRHPHHQTAGYPKFYFTLVGDRYETPSKVVFADAQGPSQEMHAILDFQAGKDLGLGLFGAHGQSVVSAGVRIAQFTANNSATLHARPIYSLGPPLTFPGKYKGAHFDRYWQTRTALVDSKRNSRALGPSLSWDASLPVIGDDSGMTVNFDWGVNAAVLFGRQRARVHHQTSGYSYHFTGGIFNLKYGKHITHYAHGPYNHTRSRSVTIPNVGGFAGISFRYSDAKISLGYRGDFFFGAMDGGIDTRKSVNRNFYGPFASISIGLP